jgi:hypothetical protein
MLIAFCGRPVIRRTRPFGGVENTQKPTEMALCGGKSKKTQQNHSFLRFFALQAVPLSRMIGLTKEEIEHFRIVLFFSNLPVQGGRMDNFLPNQNEDIGRF